MRGQESVQIYTDRGQEPALDMDPESGKWDASLVPVVYTDRGQESALDMDSGSRKWDAGSVPVVLTDKPNAHLSNHLFLKGLEELWVKEGNSSVLEMLVFIQVWV